MRQVWFVIPLFALLAGALWFAYYEWTAIEGPPMPTWGYVALIGGVLFSLVVGCGLMALMFYSHRHGYDENVDHRGSMRRPD
jgi:hypothetical protein